eukprot:1139503-Prymnesium_polylepis.2
MSSGRAARCAAASRTARTCGSRRASSGVCRTWRPAAVSLRARTASSARRRASCRIAPSSTCQAVKAAAVGLAEAAGWEGGAAATEAPWAACQRTRTPPSIRVAVRDAFCALVDVLAAHAAVIARVHERPEASVAEALVAADAVDAEGVGMARVRTSSALVDVGAHHAVATVTRCGAVAEEAANGVGAACVHGIARVLTVAPGDNKTLVGVFACLTVAKVATRAAALVTAGCVDAALRRKAIMAPFGALVDLIARGGSLSEAVPARAASRNQVGDTAREMTRCAHVIRRAACAVRVASLADAPVSVRVRRAHVVAHVLEDVRRQPVAAQAVGVTGSVARPTSTVTSLADASAVGKEARWALRNTLAQ